ncbi:Uncharacterized protein DAT39_002075, partial [Clarias magur]
MEDELRRRGSAFCVSVSPVCTSPKKMRGKTLLRMRTVRLHSATERRFSRELRALDKATKCSFETRPSYVILE